MKSIIYILVASIMLSCNSKKLPEHTGHNQMLHDMNAKPIVMLNNHQQLVANVTIDTVRNSTIYEMVTMLGTTAVNENSSAVISSRLKGRLDILYAKTPGQAISKGMALYSIYSEDLLTDEKEYLLALQSANDAVLQKDITSKLVEAARRKLVLWGLKESQINELQEKQTPSPLMTFFSDYSGVLIQSMVNEGQYVDIGTPLFTLSDLSQVWIEAQLYANEVAYLDHAQKVEVDFPYLPNQQFTAKIAFQNPALDPESKINLVRFKLTNPGMQIKPGEMAYIHFSKSSKQTIVVPRSSIVYETMPAVWVKIDEGAFEKRMVKLGIQNKKEVEILDGLKPGEVVAATGSYLINSEYILQKGAGSMGGMKM
jgi:membrane fusion protein, copper/silver efflux system